MNNRLSLAFMLALILVVALALPALAQGRNGGKAGQTGAGSCVNYVDADGDGVCDNAPQDGTGAKHGRR